MNFVESCTTYDFEFSDVMCKFIKSSTMHNSFSTNTNFEMSHENSFSTSTNYR